MRVLIDSHCHLTYEPLSVQLDAVLSRAAQAGVTELVTVGTSIADVECAIALAAAHKSIHATAGVHPHDAGKVDSDWHARLVALARDEHVVAVGETGLDYHYDFADKASQRRVFEKQLELSLEVDKPVIIHSREAQNDVLAVLASYPRKDRVVFHCFTGTLIEARELLEHGFWISLTGVVTFKKSDELREVAALIPQDRIMVETDSPYLSPEPVRNARPNEPAFVVHVARRIAAARGMTYDDFSAVATANTRRFYAL